MCSCVPGWDGWGEGHPHPTVAWIRAEGQEFPVPGLVGMWSHLSLHLLISQINRLNGSQLELRQTLTSEGAGSFSHCVFLSYLLSSRRLQSDLMYPCECIHTPHGPLLQGVRGILRLVAVNGPGHQPETLNEGNSSNLVSFCEAESILLWLLTISICFLVNYLFMCLGISFSMNDLSSC